MALAQREDVRKGQQKGVARKAIGAIRLAAHQVVLIARVESLASALIDIWATLEDGLGPKPRQATYQKPASSER
jgi:hypothetical protein